jgi:hypothetical protein
MRPPAALKKEPEETKLEFLAKVKQQLQTIIDSGEGEQMTLSEISQLAQSIRKLLSAHTS